MFEVVAVKAVTQQVQFGILLMILVFCSLIPQSGFCCENFSIANKKFATYIIMLIGF